jgi:hypothetical protein
MMESIAMKPYVTHSEDGAINYEWIDDKFRFGICIDVKPEESSWFFISKDGSIREYGLLPDEMIKQLTPKNAIYYNVPGRCPKCKSQGELKKGRGEHGNIFCSNCGYFPIAESEVL